MEATRPAHVGWLSPLEQPHLLQAAVRAPRSEDRRGTEEQHLDGWRHICSGLLQTQRLAYSIYVVDGRMHIVVVYLHII